MLEKVRNNVTSKPEVCSALSSVLLVGHDALVGPLVALLDGQEFQSPVGWAQVSTEKKSRMTGFTHLLEMTNLSITLSPTNSG